MLGPGRANFEGQVRPRPRRDQRPEGSPEPHIPIIVGGNGERVTAGYAIRYADELNYVFLPPTRSPAGWPPVRARCEAEGRDPATLRFSLYARDEEMREQSVVLARRLRIANEAINGINLVVDGGWMCM